MQIDNTPSLTVGNVAASDGWIDPSGGVDFKDNPSGNDGSVYVILDGDPKGYQYYEDAADWSWQDIAGQALIPATLSNGQHSLKIEARAANGATASQDFPINIDNTPTIDINDIGEINGSFDVGGSVAFTVHPTFYDGTVAVYFDGARQASAWVEESSWSYVQIANRLIDPTVLTSGPHTIKVIATAANQTQSEAQTTFNVDNTPNVTIDDIGKLEGFLDIKGEVKFQEATSRPDETLSLYFDDGLLAVRNMEEPSWSYDELSGRKLNAAMLSNGDHSVRLVARAHNGEEDSAQITFTIDNTPQITLNGLKQPEGQFDVTGQVTFKENPQGFEGYIKYYLNDLYLTGLYHDSTSVSIKFSDFNGKLFDTSKMTEGDYTFKVVADARNGATVTSSVTATIAHIDPLQNQGAQCGDCRTVTFTANPINFATGNKYQRQTDIVLAGPGLPLSFIRHYNSQFAFEGAFGYGWTSAYSESISATADSIVLRQSDGRHVHFIDDGSGRYLTATDKVRIFEAHSDGYTLTEPGGVKKTFDPSGLLIRIEDTNGNFKAITQTDGSISRVSDNFGRTLDFQYNSDGRLSVLTTPVGSFTYSYDALGNLDRVDHPDATFKAYIYDDPNDPHNLTGITDENGIRSLTVTYDDQDRALTSALAGGAKRVIVDYHNHFQRSVTDSLGNKTTFQLHVSRGIARVESSAGAGCSSCLASLGESHELNDRLLIDSTIDAEETRVGYTYDDRGRMLTKTEAVGTSYERTTGYSWHPVFDKIASVTRSSVAHAGQTTTSFEYDTAGNLLTVSTTGFDGTDPIGRTISYTYNAGGQVLTADGPRSDVADVITFDYYPNDAGEGLNRGRLH
ncbi:hypothetical protein D1AOALGA4SA_823, partial [Olavius algarvensis Delta 1 endosymbiont]